MSEFKLRREKLLDSLINNSVAIIYGGVSKIRSEDDHFPFSVNKNFFYLTGITQENSVLVLIKTFGETKQFLFVSEYDELKERWTGKRITFDQAREISEVESIYSVNNLDNMLEMILDKSMYGKIENVYLDLSSEIKIGPDNYTLLKKLELEEKYPSIKVENIYKSIVELRLIKSREEVNKIEDAIMVTNAGINDLLLHLELGKTEHELSDRFEYFGKTHGRKELAFETICASGKDATIMHHPVSQQVKPICDGELMLLDLGFKTSGYSADISRTYPVNGTFTQIQKDVYEAVLACNKSVIEMARPGLSIADLQEHALEVLKRESVNRGLMSEDDDIKKYYIHNVSHFLGLDTHDVGDRSIALKPGHVITVEPGLYFVERGIGVRIEDDVLITEDGCEVLSKCIAKEVNDIERLMASKRK